MFLFQASFWRGKGRAHGWEKQAGRGWFLVVRENLAWLKREEEKELKPPPRSENN